MSLTRTVVKEARRATGEINPRLFGSVGNGTVDDTVAVQAAFNAASGFNTADVVIPDGNFLVGAITVPSNIRAIYGPGTLTQKAAGANILNISGATRLLIDGITFVGVGGTTTASSNQAVNITGASAHVTVRNCRMSGFRNHGVYAQNATDILVDGCEISGTAGGIFFSGVTRGRIVNNVVRDCSLPTSTFTVAITGGDSTDGHAFGICTDILVQGNIIKTYPNAQAILFHAGERVNIVGNVCEDVSIGISCNPFNNDDTSKDIVICGNSYFGTSTSGVTTEGHVGINVQGSSGISIYNVSVTGNTIRNANAVGNATVSGALNLNYLQGVSVTGNTILDSEAAGIFVSNNVKDLTITGNVIRDITTRASSNVGILIEATGNTGVIANNAIYNCTDAVRYSASNTALTVDDCYIATVTNRVASASNGRFEGQGTYTAGATTIDVSSGARFVSVANTGATTITNLTGGVAGQIVTLVFADANTTIDRTNAELSGGVNFVSTANDTLTLIKLTDSSTWKEVARGVNS